MTFPSIFAIPIAALMAITPLSSEDPETGVQVFDGDRYQVSNRVYQDGDTTVEETIYRMDDSLPDHAMFIFDGDPNTIGEYPKD